MSGYNAGYCGLLGCITGWTRLEIPAYTKASPTLDPVLQNNRNITRKKFLIFSETRDPVVSVI